MGALSTPIAPDGVAPPSGAYSHGIFSQGSGRWLHVAGQIGTDAAGKLAEGFEGQAEQAWANLAAVLKAAGMGVSHLVKVTTYLVDRDDLARLNPIRSRYLGDARPASTLVVVAALAHPAWCFEVDAVAFLPD